MGRKATGGKPGRKSDLEPEQVEFLEAYGDRFTAGGGNGALYSEVLNKWIEKFGYAGLNPKNKNGIDPSALRLDVDLETLSEVERVEILDVREAARHAIRGKIANWFRHHYHCRKENPDGINEVIGSLLEISESRPRKKTELAMYSELHYESKLKSAFDTMWNGLLQSGIPSKQRINFIKRFTRETFLKEPEEVRAEIRERCEQEHLEALEAWKGRTDWSGTAEGYETALSNLDSVLPPFADAISKYTGMVAIVTLVGPSGGDGGEIIVRSTQSVTSKVKQTWAQADLQGYRAFQDSLLKYGQGHYTESERLARVIDNELYVDAGGEMGASPRQSQFMLPFAPSTSGSVLPQPPANGVMPDDVSQPQRENVITMPGTFNTAMDGNSKSDLGIWEDWDAFVKSLGDSSSLSGNVGLTGGPFHFEEYPPLTPGVISPVSNPLLPPHSVVNSTDLTNVERFSGPVNLVQPAVPGIHTGPIANMNPPATSEHSTLLATAHNVHRTDPLHPIVNTNPVATSEHSAKPAAPAVAYAPHADPSDMLDKENFVASENQGKTKAVVQNQPRGMAPSARGKKKRGPPKRKTVAKGGSGEQLAEVEETIPATTETAPVEGGDEERPAEGTQTGQKRKAADGAADENGSDGKRSRRKVVLPAHLEGYTAPKKGTRAVKGNA